MLDAVNEQFELSEFRLVRHCDTAFTAKEVYMN